MLSLYIGMSLAFAILVITSPIDPLSRLDNVSIRDPLLNKPRSKPLLLSGSQVLRLTLPNSRSHRVTDRKCHPLRPTNLDLKKCCSDVGCAEVAASKVVRLRCKDLDLRKFGKTGRQQFCTREGYQVR